VLEGFREEEIGRLVEREAGYKVAGVMGIR